MRRIAVSTLALFMVLLVQAPVLAGNNDTEVCQSPGKSGRSHTVRMNGNALPAFIAQGATEGACGSDEEPPPDEEPTNTAPVAAASYTIEGGFFGQDVVLDGSGSFDADGDALTYTWTVVGGNGFTATLDGVNAAFAYLAEVGYEVTLTVSDGEATDSTTLSIQ